MSEVYAKKRGFDFAAMFRPAMHTDAVTGESKGILRVAHNRPNPVLNARHRCVRAALTGQRGNSAAHWREIAGAAFRQCAAQNPGRGGRRGLPA